MPIRPEMRRFYAREWLEISRKVRFERGGGVCQCCGRPHGVRVRCLPDGRWFDAERGSWRNGRGRAARWPDLIELARIRHTRVVLAAAHLDHDPRNNRLRNLKSLCQRCHLIAPTIERSGGSPTCCVGRSAICFSDPTRLISWDRCRLSSPACGRDCIETGRGGEYPRPAMRSVAMALGGVGSGAPHSIASSPQTLIRDAHDLQHDHVIR